MLKIPSSLKTKADINGYSDAAQARKDAMHKDGAKFLKALAKELGLQPGQYSVRSNVAGIAVSGEVTLHADHLYVQLQESLSGPGLHLLYRSCRNQKDYTGGQNHFIGLLTLAEDGQQRFLETCHKLMQAARQEAEAAQ